jgi:4-hydroxyphenylpyruvate dioxygenase
MGFTHVANHHSKNVSLYRQGGIHFIINSEPDSLATLLVLEHGPSVRGMAVRVNNAKAFYAHALS